jgi:hypothetical protein
MTRERTTFDMGSAQPGPVLSSSPVLSGYGPATPRHVRKSTAMSMSPSMMYLSGDVGDGLSGRATRQRTQLIVEGFTNLALVVSCTDLAVHVGWRYIYTDLAGCLV